MHEAGPIYEPRAYWEVRNVTPTLVGRRASVVFSRENFRNGTRNPVVLDHMLFAPVGYTFNDFPGLNTPPVAVGDVDACAAMLEKCRVLVLAPDRFPFSHRPLDIAGFCEEQAHDTSMRADPSRSFSAGLLNVCRWDFPERFAMIMPRGGTLGFDLGTVIAQPTGIATDTVEPPQATIGFEEDYGKGGGNVITKEVPLFWSALAAAYPYEVDVDGLGFNGGAGAIAQLWAPQSSLTPNDWRAQQRTQAGSTKITGFSVALDQLEWEAAVQALAAPFPGEPLASIALRLPTRARGTVDGGSQMEWWRPGAPLALVSPSMSPAKVFKLARPITLNPGDCLELELEVPGGVQALPSDPAIFPNYQVGVSFTGYARIEG